ncbi:invasion associated locus B family protein [Algihabitans albus]|uniref:invasion associated locus B family protein n=1 Tax=Algihabitans albus TaxID=2164067 RepID=UPI0013C2CD55|nr:invasion associated locus B family protein [Algihabitans albus]
MDKIRNLLGTENPGRGNLRSTVCAVLALAALSAGPAVAETKTVQDWKVTCGGSGCAAHYDGQGVQLVIGTAAEGGGKRMAFRVSPNSHLGEPLAVRLDSGWQAGLTISDCDPQACQAAVAATQQASVEAAFATARGGVVAYKAGDRMVIAPISLMGFSAANGLVK